jgi:hypothetical protein
MLGARDKLASAQFLLPRSAQVSNTSAIKQPAVEPSDLRATLGRVM